MSLNGTTELPAPLVKIISSKGEACSSKEKNVEFVILIKMQEVFT